MAEIGAVLRKQQNKLGEALVKKTHFNLNEIDCLFTVYRKVNIAATQKVGASVSLAVKVSSCIAKTSFDSNSSFY